MATRKYSVIDEAIYLVCSCGQKHRLLPGTVKPVYWCGNELKELQVDDTIDILEHNQRRTMMKIKVPNEVQYGSHTYRVFLKDTSLPDTAGDAYFLEQEIRVRDRLPPSERATVFMHENLHHIDRIWCCRLDEGQIASLSEGLGQLLFSNMGIELDWSNIPTKTAMVKEEDK